MTEDTKPNMQGGEPQVQVRDLAFARGWLAGATFGWNCGLGEDSEKFDSAIKRGYAELHEVQMAAVPAPQSEPPSQQPEMVSELREMVRELRDAAEVLVKEFGVGFDGCGCRSDDCPIRNAKKIIARATKLLQPQDVKKGQHEQQ